MYGICKIHGSASLDVLVKNLRARLKLAFLTNFNPQPISTPP